jgi:hypothetical protein
MTTITETGFDVAKAEAFGGHLVPILSGSLLSCMLDIGHRTGLFVATPVDMRSGQVRRQHRRPRAHPRRPSAQW